MANQFPVNVEHRAKHVGEEWVFNPAHCKVSLIDTGDFAVRCFAQKLQFSSLKEDVGYKVEDFKITFYFEKKPTVRRCMDPLGKFNKNQRRGNECDSFELQVFQ